VLRFFGGEAWRSGGQQLPSAQPDTFVDAAQLATDRDYIGVAAAEGGEILTGAGEPAGLLQEPVVVTQVKPDHRVAQEEVFGPVVAVLAASDLDEAVQVANAVPYGLAAGIVTGDLRAAHRFADTVQAGVVKVNRPTTGLDLNVPFGSVKDSSTNTFREQGSTAVDFYTWTKSAYMGVD
jgi:aldehyde dehydrogenase (NAD+)